MWFPTVQTCEAGELRWVTIPDSVEEWDSVDEPAPYVEVTEGSGGHGASHDGEEAGEGAPASDDGTDVLTIVALALAGVGLLLGALALTRSGARS